MKYINKIDPDSVIHAFECLNHQYCDSSIIKSKVKLIEYKGDTLYRSSIFTQIINDKKYRKYIEDAITYGIIRYEKSSKKITMEYHS